VRRLFRSSFPQGDRSLLSFGTRAAHIRYFLGSFVSILDLNLCKGPNQISRSRAAGHWHQLLGWLAHHRRVPPLLNSASKTSQAFQFRVEKADASSKAWRLVMDPFRVVIAEGRKAEWTKIQLFSYAGSRTTARCLPLLMWHHDRVGIALLPIHRCPASVVGCSSGLSSSAFHNRLGNRHGEGWR
jgi:hypothetical protein